VALFAVGVRALQVLNLGLFDLLEDHLAIVCSAPVEIDPLIVRRFRCDGACSRVKFHH
jgi:hypothetical protein